MIMKEFVADIGSKAKSGVQELLSQKMLANHVNTLVVRSINHEKFTALRLTYSCLSSPLDLTSLNERAEKAITHNAVLID